jgi:WD40 repeat protein
MLRVSFCLFAANLALVLSLTSCQAQTASSTPLPPPKKTSPGIFGIGFSRDGRTLVTGNFNGTVNLWDVGSGRLLRTLDGHTDVVYRVSSVPTKRFSLRVAAMEKSSSGM